MSTATLAALSPLLTLPISDRLELADMLYASLPDDFQSSADQAWLAEAERRSAEMDSNPAAELSEEDFIRSIQLSRVAATQR